MSAAGGGQVAGGPVGSVRIDVPTPLGPARLTVDAASRARALLWLGHGAGGGIEARDLVALAAELPRHGVTVVRHEQPWRVAGKRIAPRPAALDTGWLEAAGAVAAIADGLPVFVGGRSAGARVACRTAAAVGAAGVLCLAFPLHPPGHPERSRVDELLLPDVPVLVVQGERDTFGGAQALAAEVGDARGIRVVAVPDADHALKTPKASDWDPARVDALVAASALELIDGALAVR